MNTFHLFPLTVLFLVTQCRNPEEGKTDYRSVSQVATGNPVAVMLTCYSTTLLANGHDSTRVRIAVTDSLSREITSAGDTIHLYVKGPGKVVYPDGKEPVSATDSAGQEYVLCPLVHGVCWLRLVPGTTPDTVRVEARCGKLWPGSHEIHTLPAGFILLKPAGDQLPATTKPIDRMIGADISFLPQIEDRGMKFYDHGQETDAITLLKNHGFNYIRLRIFVNPEHEKGYAPGKGYCGLSYTLNMARRIHDAGMKLLLDFHYSDYWADPQQQFKPLAWSHLDFAALKDSVRTYTARVLLALQLQGTTPAMVQIGNEINHGILWPDGHISHPDQLAALLQAGVEGVTIADPSIPVMMHIALGGQHQEAVFWLDNMLARGVRFDLIGLSYYPRWHGTLNDLDANLRELAERYHKPLNVVEYAVFIPEVNQIDFTLPGDLGKGTCNWEPLGWRSGLFDRNGAATRGILVYDTLHTKYLQ